MHPLDLSRLLVAQGRADAAVEAMHEAIAQSPAHYLVWDATTQLRQLAVALPETAGGCAKVLEVIGREGSPVMRRW
jgi:hypothetical protein